MTDTSLWTVRAVPTDEFKDHGKISVGLYEGKLYAGCDDSFYSRDFTTDEAQQIMALANAALLDDDPRKITREKVEAIQNLIDDYVPFVSTNSQLADGLLDVLRALLPPE